MKSKLKASGTKRLNLKYDNMLSSFAFNFNLRCYTEVVFQMEVLQHLVGPSALSVDK